MKILKFDQGLESLPITFDKETVWVMAFTPQVIVFENRKELKEFYYVFEDLQDMLSEEDQDKYCEMLYWFNDPFEEESFMINRDDCIGRKCQLRAVSDDMYFNDDTIIRFGVLNSKDIYTGTYHLEQTVELIEKYMELTGENLSQLVMLQDIASVLKEDVRLGKLNSKDYFKVELTEGGIG